MTVLQQMAGIDSMSALMSPAVGGGGHGMQAQMEAKLAGLRSPVASRQSFGASNRDSFGGGSGLDGASYLNPDAAFNTDSSAAGKVKANKASNRTSAPGLLNAVTPSWGAANSQLDQVLERGPSPGAESNLSGRSGGESRPKSTDFSGHANVAPGSASYPKLPQGGSNANRADDLGSLPLSPNVTSGNWASMVNTPAVPMFGAVNNQTGSNLSGINDHPAFSVPKLSDAPKRRTSGKMGPAGLSSPGSLGGGFQGSAGAWSAQRSPAPGAGDGGFNNYGLGLGSAGAGGYNGIGSPSPSDLALQMSQLQLQQLQIQQLQQLQQLGVAGAANGPGMGLGMPMGLGMGLPGLPGSGGAAAFNNLGAGAGSRNVSGRSIGSASNGGARRSPMLSSGGGFGANVGGVAKSPSPVGRRESAGTGNAGGAENEDVDIRVLEDVSQWLRTLRLHVSL